jgi:hypothetical protein
MQSAHTVQHESRMTNNAAPQGTQSLPPPDLPRLVAEQHHPLPSSDKDTQRLIVVLCNATLETYRTAAGPNRRGIQDEKYTLLNSDDHIGVMRKMGRDISEARPDITHQVSNRVHILQELDLVAYDAFRPNSACSPYWTRL